MSGEVRGFEKLVGIASNRLSGHFDYVDFSTSEDVKRRIAEIFTTDALIKAGSSISIRHLSYEDQEKRIEGIEEMMFDDIMSDLDLMNFYQRMIERNARLVGNHLVLKDKFKHHIH